MINNSKHNSIKNVSELITDYITMNIQSNKWPSGSKIPSERQLAIRFETTSATVKKVISKFIENRIIESKYRKGYFVCIENILSPGDYLGLIPDPSLKITFEEIEIEGFNQNDVEIFEEMLDKKISNSYKMFKKLTLREKKIIKTVYIGIGKKAYIKNKIMLNHKAFNNNFNVKIFNALSGNLIAKKIDVITSANYSNNPDYANCTCFHSASLNKNGSVIEYAVTYIEKNDFVFKRINEIK